MSDLKRCTECYPTYYALKLIPPVNILLKLSKKGLLYWVGINIILPKGLKT